MLTLRKIENVATGPNNRPKLAVKIVGELHRVCAVNHRAHFVDARVRGDVSVLDSVIVKRSDITCTVVLRMRLSGQKYELISASRCDLERG